LRRYRQAVGRFYWTDGDQRDREPDGNKRKRTDIK